MSAKKAFLVISHKSAQNHTKSPHPAPHKACRFYQAALTPPRIDHYPTIDESAKIFLVALGTLFPIYINTWHGIRNIDRGLVEMARSYGLSGIPLFIHVILPGALPSIMVGVRFALGLMWLTLIVAETISANSGIGYLAMNAREFLQTDVVVVAIILYALLGKLADVSAQLLERLWLRWNPAYHLKEATV